MSLPVEPFLPEICRRLRDEKRLLLCAAPGPSVPLQSTPLTFQIQCPQPAPLKNLLLDTRKTNQMPVPSGSCGFSWTPLGVLWLWEEWWPLVLVEWEMIMLSS